MTKSPPGASKDTVTEWIARNRVPWLNTRLPRDPGLMLDAGAALNHGFLVEKASGKQSEALDLPGSVKTGVTVGEKSSEYFAISDHAHFAQGYSTRL